ncbi:hypothetical protein KFU94_66490 [Chloroflexi bacterium TSY]|nr:hypothetical protein [Chloroflexi bacterium TSY]
MERSPGKQLFIDDYFIESLDGAKRVLNQPQNLTVDEPLPIHFDQPWESQSSQPGRVIYDEQNRHFRLYYRTWTGERSLLCALDSDDGLNWERPELGLVEIDGSMHNNITNAPAQHLSMIWDPYEQDEAYRWKQIDNQPSGQKANGEPRWQAHYSRDGYQWHLYPEGPHSDQRMLFNFGSPAETFGGEANPDAPYIHYSQRGSNRRTRVLGRRDSPDFLNWSGLRTVIDQDLLDPPGTEFYAAGFDPANRTDGGLHILMLHTFLTDLTEPYGIAEADRYWGVGETGPAALPARIDGFVETQLAVSRDTFAWQRFREPFIPRGTPDAWDWGMVYTDGPILHDNQLWFFYMAGNLTHNGRTAQLWRNPYATPNRRGKGVAVLRPDGYISVEAASYAPGILTTHRFRQEHGGQVQVNVDASVGELRYELLEDTGQPIPGFSAAECDPIREDTLAGVLSWNGTPGWPTVTVGQRTKYPDLPHSEFYVKLRFILAPGTKLYSLTLDPPEVTQWQVKVPGRID